MFIKTQVESLRSALAKILSVVDKKNSRPILTYTLIKAVNNSIELLATDLEVSAKLVVDASVENEGTFCVNAKNIFDIVSKLPNGLVTIKLEDTTLNISCGEIFYSLLVCSNEEYPQIHFESHSNPFEIKAHQLLNTLNKTSYAISNDETRLFLNGIYLQEINSRLRAVATDGHRLAMIESELDSTNTHLLNGIIIPKKGVYELKKICETFQDSDVNLNIDESFIFAYVKGEYYLSIRLIARDYPKYQAVIPNKISFSLIVDRDLFLDAVKRIKIMSNEKSNGVRVSLKKDMMVVTANHPSLGHAIENIPVEYSDEEFEIGFNAKYLVETFANLNPGEVNLEFNNAFSPVIVKSASLADFLGIIMPLKL